ncbi:unnamed protein product [Lota lota]
MMALNKPSLVPAPLLSPASQTMDVTTDNYWVPGENSKLRGGERDNSEEEGSRKAMGLFMDQLVLRHIAAANRRLVCSVRKEPTAGLRMSGLRSLSLLCREATLKRADHETKDARIGADKVIRDQVNHHAD